MTQTSLKTRQSESGFTLVELAIVMIIIGLLIGGILKGQELINNARVSSTVAQVKAVESGISGFRDKYGGMPGDIAGANTRLPNCLAALCFQAAVGNGDGFVQTGTANDPGAASATTNEAGIAFIQLGAAGFLGGVNSGTATFGSGTSHPVTPIGGVWNFGYSDGATPVTGFNGAAGNLQAGHYVVASNTAGAVAAATTVPFQPVQAAAIDRKVDDGMPNTGIVRALGTNGGAATNCALGAGAATDAYQEVNTSVVCGVFAKVQ